MSTSSRIVLATSNKGKIAELAEPLGALGIEVLGLADFPDLPPVEETGLTFAENALIKARAVAAATNLVAVADDSGLCVDALQGAPGVHSARYSDDLPAQPGESRDARNNRKLLDALRNVPEHERTAHFSCVMAAARPDGAAIIARGRWNGRILEAPRGQNGFGYDPLLFDPTLNRTAAELSREEKMAVSHRAQALQELLRLWPRFWEAACRLY